MFYLDSENRGAISLQVQFKYGDTLIPAHAPTIEEHHQILRDAIREAQMLVWLENYRFELKSDGSYLLKDEEAIFKLYLQTNGPPVFRI